MKFTWPPTDEQIEKLALECWRTVHGWDNRFKTEDEASREFHCQNPALIRGWRKLGKAWLRLSVREKINWNSKQSA